MTYDTFLHIAFIGLGVFVFCFLLLLADIWRIHCDIRWLRSDKQ